MSKGAYLLLPEQVTHTDLTDRHQCRDHAQASVICLSWVGLALLTYFLKLSQAFPGFFKKLLVQLVLL